MTRNLWPTFDSLDDIESPTDILEEQGKLLENATDGKIYGEVEEVQIEDMIWEDDHLEGDFAFRFVLKSKFMDNYKFVVFSFYHDITMYPVKMKLDKVIKDELNIVHKYPTTNNEDEFIKLLSKVFKSQRIKTVVGSLLKMSK